MHSIKHICCLIFFLSLNQFCQSQPFRMIYNSTDMSDYKVTDECNPGGGTQCECSMDDAGIEYSSGYMEVISNKSQKHLWINSIGYKKFIDTFPDGKPVSVSRYKYSYQTRMKVLPKPDTSQLQNPQAVHLMLQLYNGSGELWSGAKEAREGAIYWELNPWNADFGKIKVYTTNFQLAETGIILNPDTNWHTFGLELDFSSLKYQKIYVDTLESDISGIPVLVKSYPGWSSENVLGLTAESMATWPGDTCKFVFSWHQQFKNSQLYTDSVSTSMDNENIIRGNFNLFVHREVNTLILNPAINFNTAQLKIFDMTGRLVIQKELPGNPEISINQFKKGLYFAVFYSENKIKVEKLFLGLE